MGKRRRAILVGFVIVAVSGGVIAWAISQVLQFDSALRASYDHSQMRIIAHGLARYDDDHGALPPPDADWQALLADGRYVASELLTSAANEDGQQDFFYVPADRLDFDDNDAVLVYQRPGLYRGGSYVVYHSWRVELLPPERHREVIGSLALPDGTPWRPHAEPAQNPVARRRAGTQPPRGGT